MKELMTPDELTVALLGGFIPPKLPPLKRGDEIGPTPPLLFILALLLLLLVAVVNGVKLFENENEANPILLPLVGVEDEALVNCVFIPSTPPIPLTPLTPLPNT